MESRQPPGGKVLLGIEILPTVAAIGVLLAAATLAQYHLSVTLIHEVASKQFPQIAMYKFPLSWLAFPLDLVGFGFAGYFGYCLLRTATEPRTNRSDRPRSDCRVAILVPVYNEPAWLVSSTLKACEDLAQERPFRVLLLDDSTDPASASEMRDLAEQYRITYRRRDCRLGFKAGNINDAVQKLVVEPFFVVFDADQSPSRDFLDRCLHHFQQQDVAFVQAPQKYSSHRGSVARASALASQLYYCGLCPGKARDNAVMLCGTNAVFRKELFVSIGGFSTSSTTEDVDLGIRFAVAGFRGVLETSAVAVGLPPFDLAAYGVQQRRWATGNLRVLRHWFPSLMLGRVPLRYALHASLSLGWWLIGLLLNGQLAIGFLALAGIPTHHTWVSGPALLASLLLPAFVLVAIWVFSRGGREGYTLRDALMLVLLVWNSMFSYTCSAWLGLVLGRVGIFERTPREFAGAGLRMIRWNIFAGILCHCCSIFGFWLAAVDPSAEILRQALPTAAWFLVAGAAFLSSVMFISSEGISSAIGVSCSSEGSGSKRPSA